MQYSFPCIYSSDHERRRSTELDWTVPIRLSSLAGGVALSKISADALRVILAKPLILCIEDEAIHLILRKKVLEREGYGVIGVTTAADALKALQEYSVCAIIADHMLQGTTGTELAAEMKKIKPTVPIILFSGMVPQQLKDVDVYVNKGEPTATFLGIVREVVQRSCS
jgi:CheY-like chemotaxis protein